MAFGAIVRGVGIGAVLAAGPLLLAGCSGETPAYVELQHSITRSIVRDDHRPVSSVSCRPRVSDVSYSDGIVDLNCLVRFPDGSSYSTKATIEARSYSVAGWNFTFDEPGPVDITTARLPAPTASLPATAAASLFYERNLRPAVDALQARFGGGELIVSMALYPGELEAVVARDGDAYPVSVDAAGKLTVGPRASFDGQRSGIQIAQLDPAVPERLARAIARRAGVATGDLQRFALSLSGGLAGWDIYTSSGSTRFRAHLQGDALEQLTATGARRL